MRVYFDTCQCTLDELLKFMYCNVFQSVANLPMCILMHYLETTLTLCNTLQYIVPHSFNKDDSVFWHFLPMYTWEEFTNTSSTVAALHCDTLCNTRATVYFFCKHTVVVLGHKCDTAVLTELG